MSRVRGFRGATTLDADDADQMMARVKDLVHELVERNDLDDDDLVSAVFTTTPDLVSAFPATAARQAGLLRDVPLIAAVEQDVTGALPRCVRVLLHAYTDRPRADVRHVFLQGAVVLRPDLAAR